MSVYVRFKGIEQVGYEDPETDANLVARLKTFKVKDPKRPVSVSIRTRPEDPECEGDTVEVMMSWKDLNKFANGLLTLLATHDGGYISKSIEQALI